MATLYNVELEKRELDAKIESLQWFIERNLTFNILTQEAQDLLHKQLASMKDYSDILNRRLEIWQDV